MKTGPFNTFDNYVNSTELQLKGSEENSIISVASYEQDKQFCDEKNPSSSVPNLESSYEDEEPIDVEEYDVNLVKRETTKELHAKKIKNAINSGELIERVERHGNEVKLFFNEDYKAIYPLHRINIVLGLIYQQSSAFQNKFEKPWMGREEKNLKLREEHGYVDDAEILADIKRFAARKKSIKYKALLAEGKLFERAEKSTESVGVYHLVPRDEYNTPEHLLGINQSIKNLHNNIPSFKSKYSLWISANELFTLKPKSMHSIQSDEILADLITYARKSKRVNKTYYIAKTKHSEDIAHVGDNYVDENISSTSEPNLESYHEQPIDVEEYQQNLTEPDNFSFEKLKSAIHSGNLLEKVERHGNQVKLFIKEPYKSTISFNALSQVLLRMYRNTPGFKSKFEKPLYSDKEQMLKLRHDHGYVDDAEILADIKRFAVRKKGMQYKVLLARRDLFERVEKSSEDAGVYHLVLKDEYNMPENREGINLMIKELHSNSDEFRAEYSLGNKSNMLFTLKVKAPKLIQDDNKVLSDLALYAKETKFKRKTANVKKRNRLDDDAVITISNESENSDIALPPAKIARRDQPEIHNVEARVNNGQFLILFQQKSYVNNPMDIDQSSRDLSMRDASKKTSRSEDEILPKAKKPRLEPLKTDTVEGEKSEGEFISNFNRKAKVKAIDNIKSQMDIDEEPLAYIADTAFNEPLLIRFKTSLVRSALSELTHIDSNQMRISLK